MTTALPILRLAAANFRARATRVALTIAAVALSVALVVAITSGYASIEKVVRSFVEDFIGSVDFEVTSVDDPRPAIAPTLLAALRADPRVEKVTGRIEVFATPDDKTGEPLAAARLMLYGLEDDPSSLGRTPRMDAGRFLRPGDRNVIVLDQNAIETLGMKVGDRVRFAGGSAPMEFEIVGILHRPTMMRSFLKTGYVAIADAQAFAAPDRPGHVTKARGEFRPNVDGAQFSLDWKPRFEAENLRGRRVRDSRADLDRNLLVFRLASYLGSTVGLSAAAFIILATMMTGVQEQRRQLAMLRAIGASRWQVARLVSLEGVLLGVSGALLGVPMGIAGIYLISFVFPAVFENGVVLAWGGALYAVAVAAGAAFVASLLPAVWASRARPLEAMSEATAIAPRLPWRTIVAGLILIALDSLVIFLPLESIVGLERAQLRELRLFGHFLLGLPAMLLGALLFAPLVVGLVESVGQRVMATLFRVPAPLLRQQLTESTWRSAATGVAMMIGLMLLITMNAQSRSALGAWKLPNKFPDVFILPDTGAGSISIRAREVELIKALPELQPGKVMPIMVTAPTLGQQIFDVAGTKMPDKTLFVGIDPRIAFEMMELDFLQGTPAANAAAEATAKRMMSDGRAIKLSDGSVVHATVDADRADALDVTLLDGTPRTIAKADIKANNRGRYIIVTNEFKKLRGYDVGQSFALEAGITGGVMVDFVIVGVVWSPGLDVMLNTFDLPARVREQTAATVFGTLDDGREVFFVKDAFLIAANTRLGVTRTEVAQSLRRAVGRGGLSVSDVRELKHTIETAFGRIVAFASTIAWAAMAVATLGVGNAIVAAVRVRQWRFGVLRAIGLTRGELLRLLLAEAVLLCVVGVALGVGLGLLLSMNANHLYAVALGFDPPLILPWDVVIRGAAVVLLLGLLATIGPAVMAARREPLSLLQAGRASA